MKLHYLHWPARMVLCLWLLCVLGSPVQASQTVALFLTLNGSPIQGDSSQTSLGRENSIECLSFESEFFRPGTGTAVHRPVKLLKRVDKASPRLVDSFGNNHTGTAQFRFYRPNPSGDGTTENFLRVELEGVRLTSVRLMVPNTINPATANDPPMDEITLSYSSYRIIYTSGGIEGAIRVDRP